LKRHLPKRYGPIRNKALPVAPVASGPSHTRGPGYTVGAIVDESVKTAMRAVEAADATVRGAVERGVDTAYTVIEEYMLRGRQAAGRNHGSRNGRNDMNDERQNGGASSGYQSGGYNGGVSTGYQTGGYSGGPWNAFNPMMAPWIQLMRMWTDNMAAFMPPGMSMDWMNQFMPGGSAWGVPSGRASVSVGLASERPVEVKADIDAGAEYLKLTAEPLTVGDSNGVPLHAHLECTPGHVSVRLTIPPTQPAGRYVGAVHDAAGVKRGQIIVDVESLRGAASPAKASKRARKPRAVKR
jgi:hypothetical protein